MLKKFPCDRQLDLMDCGPACLKSIAKHYGKFYSLQFLRDKCGITKEGVSFLDLSHAAESIGLRSLSLKCSIDDLLYKIPLPVIVHWDNSHFVVVYKVEGKKLKVESEKFKVGESERPKSENGEVVEAASRGGVRVGESESPGSEDGDSEKRLDANRLNAKGTIYVADPAKGHVKYSTAEFAAKWVKAGKVSPSGGDLEGAGAGVLMAVEPQADFYERQGDERLERRKTFENFLGYFKPYKKSFVNLFVVMLLVTILQGILPFISKAVIDVGIQTHDIDFINIVLLANVAIIVSMLLSNMVRDWILLHVTSRINIALISDYLIKLMLLPITFFENKLTGDILQRAQDHERIRSFIMNNSLNMIFSTLTFLVFSVIMFIYNPIIVYIFLAGSVIYVAWVMAFLKIRKKLDWEYFDLVSKNQSYWVETIASIQDITINNYEKQKR